MVYDVYIRLARAAKEVDISFLKSAFAAGDDIKTSNPWMHRRTMQRVVRPLLPPCVYTELALDVAGFEKPRSREVPRSRCGLRTERGGRRASKLRTQIIADARYLMVRAPRQLLHLRLLAAEAVRKHGCCWRAVRAYVRFRAIARWWFSRTSMALIDE